MTQRLHNPFNTLALVRPAEQEDQYRMYCQTKTKRTSVDRSPFPRMVDLWFAGISLAARKQLAPLNLTGLKTSEFVEGSILDRDSWRIQIVMLIAIAVENDVRVVLDPHKMLRIANGLAAVGVPLVAEMLRGPEPIWSLSEALETLLQDPSPSTAAAEES